MPSSPSEPNSLAISRGNTPRSNQSPTSGSTLSRTSWRTVSRRRRSSSESSESIASTSWGSTWRGGGACPVMGARRPTSAAGHRWGTHPVVGVHGYPVRCPPMADVGVAAPSFVSQAPKLGFVGGFDGVRGIGIMLVLAQHAYPLLFPSVAGIIDVFFVMSAFLIVSLLLQEHRSLHDINMRRFYARRALRLLPSAYLCLLAWVVVSLLFDRDRLVWVLQDAAAAVTYVYNLVFPVGIEAVDPQAASQRSIDQFWSLAVEEQFYLMVAVTVLVCIRKRWITQLAVVMVAIATYIGLARLFGQTGPWPGGPTNSSVPARGLSLLWLSRPDSLMWGVALAVLNARLPD